MVKNFKDLNITSVRESLIGEKIDIYKVLNCEILLEAYKIEPSKYQKPKGNGNCLHLQFSIKGVHRVIFSASVQLMKQIVQIPHSDFPVKATIVKDDQGGFEFT